MGKPLEMIWGEWQFATRYVSVRPPALFVSRSRFAHLFVQGEGCHLQLPTCRSYSSSRGRPLPSYVSSPLLDSTSHIPPICHDLIICTSPLARHLIIDVTSRYPPTQTLLSDVIPGPLRSPLVPALLATSADASPRSPWPYGRSCPRHMLRTRHPSSPASSLANAFVGPLLPKHVPYGLPSLIACTSPAPCFFHLSSPYTLLITNISFVYLFPKHSRSLRL